MFFTEMMRRIISVDELNEFSKVEKILEKEGEGFIFQNNKPTHVIMTLEYYKNFKEGGKSQNDAVETVMGLDVLLNKIGKKIFVDYYKVFKMDDNPEVALAVEGFTLTSRRSRSSSARTIFRNNQQIDALNNIINSDRIDTKTIERAKKLLEMEKKGIYIENEESDEDYDIKIGKMMKAILSKFIQNGVLSDKELLDLQDVTYSKKVMNLNFPVIKEVEAGQSVDIVKKDINGYNRYYDASISYKGKTYIICSQWVQSLHYDSVKEWIKGKIVSILINLVQNISKGEKFEIKSLLKDYWYDIDNRVRRLIGTEFKIVALEKGLAELSEVKGVKEVKNDAQVYVKIV